MQWAPHMHSLDDTTFLGEMTSWLPSWKCDIKLKVRLCRWMGMYLREKQSYQISFRSCLKQRSFRLFESVAPTRTTTTTTRWEATWEKWQKRESIGAAVTIFSRLSRVLTRVVSVEWTCLQAVMRRMPACYWRSCRSLYAFTYSSILVLFMHQSDISIWMVSVSGDVS